jgi:hypothetical protein
LKHFCFLILKGGVGIKNSIDILAPMFEDGSSEAPRLVSSECCSCYSLAVLIHVSYCTNLIYHLSLKNLMRVEGLTKISLKSSESVVDWV